MHSYLVEVTLPEAIAAKRIADSVRSIGSHFATHAAWRRKAGVCTGTMVVEAADRSGALGIVPPGMRADTHVFNVPLSDPRASAGSLPSQRPMSEIGLILPVEAAQRHVCGRAESGSADPALSP